MASDWDSQTTVRCLAIAPSDGNVIYVARNDLLVRSDFGGGFWQPIDGGLPNLSPTSFAVDPIDPMHVWISFSGTSAGSKVYESFSGGDTWNNLSIGLPNVPVNSLALDPGMVNGIYAGTDLGVFYRDDILGAWEPFGVSMPNVVVSEVESEIWQAANCAPLPTAGASGRPICMHRSFRASPTAPPPMGPACTGWMAKAAIAWCSPKPMATRCRARTGYPRPHDPRTGQHRRPLHDRPRRTSSRRLLGHHHNATRHVDLPDQQIRT